MSALICDKIDNAISAWVVESFTATRNQQEPPIIEEVGISTIDKALPLLIGDARKARIDFLSVLKYLSKESPEAPELRNRRKDKVERAATFIREAAALLEDADNAPIATLLYSIAEKADYAQYGCIYPKNIHTESMAAEGTPEKRAGALLDVHLVPDALTGNFNSKRGKTSHDANIVRALALYFPDNPDFWSNGGYALISGLAQLCGAETATNQYVRQTIQQAKRTAEPKPEPRRDSSIIGLFFKPKI